MVTRFLISLLLCLPLLADTNLQGVVMIKLVGSNPGFEGVANSINQRIDRTKLRAGSAQVIGIDTDEPMTKEWTLVYSTTNDAVSLWKWLAVTNSANPNATISVSYHACPRSTNWRGQWGPCSTWSAANYTRTNR